MDTQEAGPAELDPAELTAVVRLALGSESVELASWGIQPLTPGRSNPASAGVYRVAGTAHDRGEQRPWSVVLKVTHAARGSDTTPGYWPGSFSAEVNPESAPMYWKREILAYESGVLADLPGGLVAPRCFRIVERGPDVYWLWLEDIVAAEDEPWSGERYTDVARRLGRFNGAYLTGFPLPADSWARRGWLRAWIHLVEQYGGLDRIATAAWEVPTVRRILPPSLLERFIQLWQERSIFLAALDRLPPTFCHRDAFPGNLLIRTTGGQELEVVAIDWQFAGIGPVGEELGPLLTTSARGVIGAGPMESFREAILGGYIQGLREAGWSGDERLARFGCAASIALRDGVLTSGVILLYFQQPDFPAKWQQRRGYPFEQVVEEEAGRFSGYLAWSDQARALMP